MHLISSISYTFRNNSWEMDPDCAMKDNYESYHWNHGINVLNYEYHLLLSSLISIHKMKESLSIRNEICSGVSVDKGNF